MIELRASGGRRLTVEGGGIDCFAAVTDIFGTNFEEFRLGLLEASGAVTKVRFPGERLRATA